MTTLAAFMSKGMYYIKQTTRFKINSIRRNIICILEERKGAL